MPTNETRHLLIFFKTGSVVKIENLPPGFDFASMCLTVRSDGYFNNGYVYFDHAAISSMAWVKSDQEVQMWPTDMPRSTH